jgi:hypothetical protein
MKKIIISSIVLIAVALGMSAQAQTFTPGNLVVYRLGGDVNGLNSIAPGGVLTNIGTTVWLDEYNLSGGFVQSHMMPTNFFGANSPLIGAGTTFGSGLINLSGDGRSILVCGYGATIGQVTNFSLESEFGTQVPRVIGLVNGNGRIDTTTAMTNSAISAEEERSATSPDGTNIWFAGDGFGGHYTTYSSSTSTQLSTANTNLRGVSVFSNTLYFASSGIPHIGTVGTQPPPMTNGSTLAVLPSIPPGLVGTNTSPFSFVLLNLNNSVGPDTLYVADSTSNNVIKYSLVAPSVNWVNNGSIGFGAAVGLAAQVRIVGGIPNVDLFTTGGGGTLSGVDSVWSTTDSSGFNAAPVTSGNSPFGMLFSSAPGVSFRGICFAPSGGDAFPAGPGTLSVGPILDFFSSALTGCSYPDTQVYSLGNFGTTPINWTATATQPWVILSPASGTMQPGDTNTVTASFTVGAQTTGTNTAIITFANTSNGNGTVTRNVRLILRDQILTPSTDFTSSGQPGGPFNPTNKVYTLTNSASATINWTANKSNAGDTWFTIIPPSGTLGSCSSTTITISNTAAANALTAGNYADVVTFSNNTGVIDTRNVSIQAGSLFFCDDFSTFTSNSPVAGQQGWLTVSGSLSRPTVTNNAVYVAAAQAVAAEEPYKNFPVTTNNNVYAAMVMTVTSAPPVTVTSPSYAIAIWNVKDGPTIGSPTAFGLYRLSMRDTGTNQFLFCVRTSSQGGTPLTFDTTPRNYGTAYRVIIETDPLNNTNTWVYVNPVSATLTTNNATFVSGATGTFTRDVGVGCIQFGNTFATATSIQPGIAVSKMCITTNFADAYNDITVSATPDPFTTWQNQYFNMSQLLNPAFSGPGADPFGKGMSNTNQFLAGFNPVNASAYLHITAISKVNAGADIRVDYLGASGDGTRSQPGPLLSRTNVLEFTAGTAGNYNSNTFASTGVTNILSGGVGIGTLTNMVDPGGATHAPARYYRVRVLVP